MFNKSKFKEFNPLKHTLKYLETEYGITASTLLYKRMSEIKLSDEDLAHALWVSVETCLYCYDNDISCQCWNDE